MAFKRLSRLAGDDDDLRIVHAFTWLKQSVEGDGRFEVAHLGS